MKVNVGVVSLVGPLGPPVIVVFGAVVSTTKVCVAGEASTFPTVSTARTANVCEPWETAGSVRGEVQVANAAVSTRHWNVPASVEVNANVGVVSLVGEAIGVSVVSGAVASTVNAREAIGGFANVPSSARTENVYAPLPSAL